jgi:hypothetical protein
MEIIFYLKAIAMGFYKATLNAATGREGGASLFPLIMGHGIWQFSNNI